MKNTDFIITNYALIKQKKAKITCLSDFYFLLFFCLLFFLLFAIRCRLRSHFKNSCFVFSSRFQTLEHNWSPRPNGLGLSSVFSSLETPVKHSHSFLKYYVKHFFVVSVQVSPNLDVLYRHDFRPFFTAKAFCFVSKRGRLQSTTCLWSLRAMLSESDTVKPL